MTPKDAADKLRPDFHLAQMPAEDRHHVRFVEDVAVELGVEATPFNLQQVARALDAADLHGDDLHFPLMLYSRQHHAVDGVAASTYYPRHDMTFVTVENEEQLKALGPGWVENPADLPERGEIPINAPLPERKDLPEPGHAFDSDLYAGGHFDPSNPDHVPAQNFTVSDADPRNAAILADQENARLDHEMKAKEEMRAEQARVDETEKAAAAERARMAVLQTIAKDSRAEIHETKET